MKKLLMSAAMLGLVFAAAPLANAATYNPDMSLGGVNLGNSGDATEKAALCTAASLNAADCTSLTLTKTNTPDASLVAFLDDVGNWVIDVGSSTPGYFLLKFGNTNIPGTFDTYFFKNIAELGKLVWTNAQVGFATGGCQDLQTTSRGPQPSCNIGKLSHFSISGDIDITPDPVPLPGGIVLLLSGLAGLAGLSRMRKAAAKA